jgi:putative NAD(P)-binding protein
MERVITGSGLDWTIVRPPMLTDKAGTGMPRFGFTSRADVADFAIKSVENHASMGRIAGVCD